MANHASAAKRARQRVKRTLKNRLVVGSLRTSLKKARAALSVGSAEAGALVEAASRAAAKAASKGAIHSNAASRLQSRLSLALNRLAGSR